MLTHCIKVNMVWTNKKCFFSFEIIKQNLLIHKKINVWIIIIQLLFWNEGGKQMSKGNISLNLRLSASNSLLNYLYNNFQCIILYNESNSHSWLIKPLLLTNKNTVTANRVHDTTFRRTWRVSNSFNLYYIWKMKARLIIFFIPT